jgi:two-component system phosphate regulon sensor histidine kinase PhoR
MRESASGSPDGLRRALQLVPRPLIRQLLLLVPVLLDLVLLLTAGKQGVVTAPYLVGLTILLAATGAAAVSRLVQVPAPVLALLPVLDIAAIGLMRLVPDGNGLGILVVLPAMWLAADLKMRGVAVATVSVALLASTPSLLYFGADSAWWSRALLLTVVAAMCALTVAGTAQVWERQNRELEDQRADLREALDAVEAGRALNEAIVSTVDVGLVALDRTGAYTVVNPRQADFLALAYPDGHHGRAGQPGAVYAADRVTRLGEHDLPTSRAMRGERFADYVIWVGAEPARQRALSVSAGPVLDASGSFDGAVLVYKDITELMSALRVKDEFVASVSHELRTPLTSIMGFLDLVLDEDDSVSRDVRQQLDVVKRNAERLLRLVSDLLVTAQAAEGRMALEVLSVDLSAMVQQAVAELAPQAAAKEIALEQQLAPCATVRADPTRIRQLVDNLLSNAIKYTPPGGQVSVRLQELGEEVELLVRDTGIGMSAEDLSSVFTRFFRSEDAESRAIQGIGLGLAISRSIVDAHDGRIEVESAVGEGSTFRVRLPRKGPHRTSESRTGRGGEPSRGEGSAGSPPGSGDLGQLHA